LLVDAEAPVHAGACAHLQARDGWDLGFASDKMVHLMAQIMEAWIVADTQALAAYYGQNFRVNALPRTQDLEAVLKTTLASALDQATRDTQKGTYHKIRHASDLLRRINREKVKKRCYNCDRMFKECAKAIRDA
jgi:hypothetical protein